MRMISVRDGMDVDDGENKMRSERRKRDGGNVPADSLLTMTFCFLS